VCGQDLPPLFRDAVLGGPDAVAADPGHLRRWPDCLGQRHAGGRTGQTTGFLDSGALYRITALAATRAALSLDADGESAIAALVAALDIRFEDGQILLGTENVSDLVRTEAMGMNASRVSTLPQVRNALIALQHAAQRLPGLVADGRDMGTVIFPQAPLKVFLTASAARRAERRHKQLISKGFSATLSGLRADLEARDARDSSRSTAPLKPAQDARALDNSDLTVDASVDQVLVWWNGMQPFATALPDR
jgi:3-phosphoshikimate 1-carboxyvinyltransferase